ncbi:hypothetical protein GQ44DRAFT_780690 [Phaeosphaeriaceae sp. PMI808]|nr:hypothetical protein GQ44DRAFT_780690 [Phaeosphaeriaceae sp. PMI808]
MASREQQLQNKQQQANSPWNCSTPHLKSSSSSCTRVMEAITARNIILSPSDTPPRDAALSSWCSDTRSADSWLGMVFAARGQSSQRPASTTTRSRNPAEQRLTRSKSRQPQTTDRDEPVEASVAALRIGEEGGDNEVVNNTRIALPPSSSANNCIVITNTTATSSPSKKGHGRSTSPVKSMVGLALLNRKVERIHMTIKDYPDTIRQLMRNIRDIQRGKGMIPHEIRSTVESREDVEAEEWWWSTTSSSLSKSKPLVELEMMDEVLCETHKQHDEAAAEPGWNDKVHSLMLRQVCMHLPGIEYQNITTARPDPRLVPKTGLTHTESKLVDYALICDKTLIPPHLVERILADTCNGIDSINHTRDSVQSLRRSPIAVSFETKTPNGSESEALTQLSLWAVTHFNRLRSLLPPGKRDIVSWFVSECLDGDVR